jgi:formyltetrahydrofolate deformylase
LAQPVLAVVSVLGKDQKGVVAQFATYMAERGINIEDIEQRVVSGIFLMDMLVDLRELSCDLSELITGLLGLGKKIDMEVRVHLRSERRKKNVAILVSKEPHCLRQLAADFSRKKLNGNPVVVLANHPDLEPIAKDAGIPFFWRASGGGASGGGVSAQRGSGAVGSGEPGSAELEQHFAWLAGQLSAHAIDLVVLARYMRVLPPAIVNSYRNRIINIHPSLLPFFPGASAYKQAFEKGVRVHGCTAHFVTEQLDQGPVIMQDVFHINVGVDTLEEVKENGLSLEAKTLGKAVQLYLDEELVVVDGKVIFKPGLSRFLKEDAKA